VKKAPVTPTAASDALEWLPRHKYQGREKKKGFGSASVGGDTSAGHGFLDTSIKKKKRKKEVLVVRVLAVTHLVVWKVSSILVLRKEKKGSGSAVRSVGLVLAVTHLVWSGTSSILVLRKRKKKKFRCRSVSGVLAVDYF
jgi:hypothetical protein